MSFEKNGYAVIRNVLNFQTAKFLEKYMLLKRKVFSTFSKVKYYPDYDDTVGSFGDGQVNNQDVFCLYGDPGIESLFDVVTPVMEQETGLSLLPTYGYSRIYMKGSELVRHKDRFSCEISTTIALGGPSWPIYILPEETSGKYMVGSANNFKYHSDYKDGIKVDLNPGDIMIYRGNKFEHWRNPTSDDNIVQCFLHYNDATNKDVNVALKNVYDTRPHLGLPSWFQNENWTPYLNENDLEYYGKNNDKSN